MVFVYSCSNIKRQADRLCLFRLPDSWNPFIRFDLERNNVSRNSGPVLGGLCCVYSL